MACCCSQSPFARSIFPITRVGASQSPLPRPPSPLPRPPSPVPPGDNFNFP